MNQSPRITPEALSSLAAKIQAKIDGLTDASDEALVSLYFDIGASLNDNKLNHGDIAALSEDISSKSGLGDFSTENLETMARFHAAYGHHDVLKTLVTAVDWPKHVAILNAHSEEKALEFYIRMTRKFGWSDEVLAEKLETFRPQTS